MGYHDKWGEWVEDEPESFKPSLHTKIQGEILQGKLKGRHQLQPEEQRKGAIKGASLGGVARSTKLTPERRREIARLGGLARQGKS